MEGGIDRAMFDGGAGGMGAQIVAVFPIVLWPDRARRKAAATIGADVVQNGFDTATAEGAFERANHRLD